VIFKFESAIQNRDIQGWIQLLCKIYEKYILVGISSNVYRAECCNMAGFIDFLNSI